MEAVAVEECNIRDVQSRIIYNRRRRKKVRDELIENESILENTKPISKKKKSKKRRAKKKNVTENPPHGNDVSSEIFTLDEITNNKEASSLIQDLVKCFTCNTSLPQKELDILNRTLYEKTVSIILDVLNKSIEKIFNKLLNTEFFSYLLKKRRVVKKNALCQTIITYENSIS